MQVYVVFDSYDEYDNAVVFGVFTDLEEVERLQQLKPELTYSEQTLDDKVNSELITVYSFILTRNNSSGWHIVNEEEHTEIGLESTIPDYEIQEFDINALSNIKYQVKGKEREQVETQFYANLPTQLFVMKYDDAGNLVVHQPNE